MENKFEQQLSQLDIRLTERQKEWFIRQLKEASERGIR